MKDTDELKRILQNTHIENVGEYIKNSRIFCRSTQ